MPRLAANITLLFKELPLPERLRAAADAGFTAVECLWPYEIDAAAFRDQAAQHGLTVALINTPIGAADDPHLGLAACAGREADFQLGFRQALRYARTAGASRIHVMVGAWPATEDNTAALIANLRHAGKEAADAGVALVIEPINARDRPEWFLRSTAQALTVIEAVGMPAVQLLFDIYHVQILEGDLIRRIEACADRIGHVQIAGVPDRHEPDEGEVNLPAVLATLNRVGYEGFVGCEYNPRGATRDGLGWARAYGVVPRDVSDAPKTALTRRENAQ